MQDHDAIMMETYRERIGSSFAKRATVLLVVCALALLGALPSVANASVAWADAPAASSTDDKPFTSSAWQAKPQTDEDKAHIAQAIQQEAYAQQGESGSTGYVGPYYAIERRFVTDIENSFQQATEEQNMVSMASTGLAASAVVIAILAALCLVKASRVRARANVLRNRGR